jgi:modulator of FtsH protease
MSGTEFASSILGWHDFFLATAGASAALLGLLFVGVSINLATIAAAERVDLRARARLAFANLLYVLGISLVMLIPEAEPHGIGAGIAAIAALGLVRVGRGFAAVIGTREHLRDRLPALRRMGWTIAGGLILLYVAIAYFSNADAKSTVLLMAAILILLIGAADVSWEMLVLVSDGPDRT